MDFDRVAFRLLSWVRDWDISLKLTLFIFVAWTDLGLRCSCVLALSLLSDEWFCGMNKDMIMYVPTLSMAPEGENMFCTTSKTSTKSLYFGLAGPQSNTVLYLRIDIVEIYWLKSHLAMSSRRAIFSRSYQPVSAASWLAAAALRDPAPFRCSHWPVSCIRCDTIRGC